MRSRTPGRRDWTAMTLADWLDVTPAEWMDRALPGWSGAMSSLASAWPAPPGVRGHRHHDRDCDCDEHHHCRGCRPESCECVCCVGDVDVVVYSRAGEQRVVPIVLENERRRESRVTLELSEWTTRGGSPGPMSTVSLEPRELTLAPCSEREVTLVVKVDAVGSGVQGQARDVDSCLIVTADLRLAGCEHRPVRIAVAVVPRFCGAFKIRCGCACC